MVILNQFVQRNRAEPSNGILLNETFLRAISNFVRHFNLDLSHIERNSILYSSCIIHTPKRPEYTRWDTKPGSTTRRKKGPGFPLIRPTLVFSAYPGLFGKNIFADIFIFIWILSPILKMYLKKVDIIFLGDVSRNQVCIFQLI